MTDRKLRVVGKDEVAAPVRKKPVDPKVIQLLEGFLVRAMKGELTSIAILYHQEGKEFGHMAAGDFNHQEQLKFVGLAQMFAADFTQKLIEGSY